MKKKLLFTLLALIGCIGAWAAPISSLSETSGTKVYTIRSARGNFVYKADQGDWVCGSTRVNYPVNLFDQNFMFSIQEDGGNYYLYSVGANKYACYNGSGVALQEERPAAAMTLLASTGGTKDTYPTVIAINGSNQLNMSTDQGHGILTNWNNTGDAGNMLAIEEVECCTYDFATNTVTDNRIPFEYADSYEHITKWYAVRLHSNQTHYMYSNGTAIEFSDAAPAGAKEYGWAFVGDPVNGFKIYNNKAGSSVMLSDDNPCTLSATENIVTLCPSTAVNFANGGFAVKTTGQYYNYQGGAIKRWSEADAGSTWRVTEIDLSVDAAAREAKANALAIANSSSVLFGSASQTAIDAINAVTYDNTSESAVAAAVIDYNNIVKTMYPAANGKKIVFYNTNRNNKYMVVTDAVQLSGENAADGRSEFVVNYVADSEGHFTLQNTATGRYIANTPATSNRVQLSTTPGEFTIKSWGTDNKFAFISVNPANATHNSLHLDGSHRVVAWEADQESNASVWIIQESTLTPEQLADGVEAVKNQIKTIAQPYVADQNTFGANLNQYQASAAYTSALAAYNAADENTTFEELWTLKESLKTEYASLAINMPQANSFLRIRSVKTGMGYVNAEASSAHSGCLAVGSKGNSSIYFYDGNHLLSYSTGLNLVKNTDGQGFLALGEVGAEGATIGFAGATQQAGSYTVSFGGRYLYAADNASNVDAGGSEGNNGYDFWLENVTELPITLSVVEGKSYSTFFCPVAVTLPDGVQAYVVTKDSETHATLTSIESGVVPENTGVVLYSKTGLTSANLTIGGSDNGETSEMTGSAATIAAVECATLQNGASGVGLYSYNGTTLKGFKAYLPASSGVKSLVFNFDEETIINGIAKAEQKAGAIYDMSGRQVNNAQKGIYIQNGKKFIVK